MNNYPNQGNDELGANYPNQGNNDYNNLGESYPPMYEGGYDYTPTEGGYGYPSPPPEDNKKNSKVLIALLVVLLCVTLVGSALIIGILVGKSDEPEGEDEEVTDVVNSDDPNDSDEPEGEEFPDETAMPGVTQSPIPSPETMPTLPPSGGMTTGAPIVTPIITPAVTPIVTPIPTPIPTPKPGMTAHKANVSWTQANQAAASMGGRLVSIDSASEFTRACNLAQAQGITVFWVNPYSSYRKWLPGEPSYVSENGEQENCLMVFKVKGAWYFNDSVNNVNSVYNGKIGYVVEY